MHKRLPRSRPFFFCLLAAALPAAGLAANTYYVSPSGNDSNNGLSQDQPWQSVARVNSTPLQPGDSVLFQRGGQWHESLIAPSDGAAGAPITFADYGSGAKPKFWGSVVLNNSQFQAVGNGLYLYNIGAPVYAALVNQNFFNYSYGQPAYNVNGSWSWSNGQLLLNSASDPRSDGRVYSAVLRDDVIYSNYKSHLVFRNLVADESARYDNNGGYGVRVMGSTDVLLDGCEAYHAGKHHIGVINSTAFVGRNLYAAYAAPGQGVGGASAYVSYGDTSTGMLSQTSEWHNIFASNMDDPQDNTVYQSFTNHGATLSSVLVDGLNSVGASVTVTNADNTNGTLRMTGGLLQNTRLEVGGDHVVVDGVTLTGPQATVDVTASHTLLQNLLIHGTNLRGEWYQTAVLIRGVGDFLRFSTIELDPNSGYNTAVAFQSAGASAQLYGNVLLAPRRALALWDFGLSASTLAFGGYNFYLPGTTYAQYGGGIFQWVDLPLTQLQALGLDPGSKQGDPGFTDGANGNYRPRAGSPLIDAVTIAPGLLTSIPTDVAGAPRPQGAAFDIGAYETGAASGSSDTVAPSSPSTSPVVTTPSTPPVVTTPTPPTTTPSQNGVTLASPGDGQTVSGFVVVSASITRTLDAAGSYLLVDGAPVSNQRDVVGPYIYPFDTTLVSPGQHTLQIWTHDISNATVLSNSIVVNVVR